VSFRVTVEEIDDESGQVIATSTDNWGNKTVYIGESSVVIPPNANAAYIAKSGGENKAQVSKYDND
jgi:hypothetical protein